MHSHTRISDIGLYLRCPRLVYINALRPLPRKLSSIHLILRGLMLSLSDCDDLEVWLKACLAKMEQDLPLIYPEEIDPLDFSLAIQKAEELLPRMAQDLAPALSCLLPSEVEVDLRSERHGLSGRLDRLVTEGCIPSIIRTGSAPADGVWKRDRLQLAGYAMLVEENYKKRVSQGLVEYPRAGLVRKIQIHSVDRGRVLRLRDRIQQIKEGRLPDRPKDARCEGCEVREKCETRCSLASKFF